MNNQPNKPTEDNFGTPNKPVDNGRDDAQSDIEDMREYMKRSYLGALEANAGAFSSAPSIVFADYMVLRIAAYGKAREKKAELYGRLHQTIELFQSGRLSTKEYSKLHDEITDRISKMRPLSQPKEQKSERTNG